MHIVTTLPDTLLQIADTKLVLANVCIAAVFNGRSIGDFATVLAIAGTSLGATRALYRLLEDHGWEYQALERGRDREGIASSDLLDGPPQSWADLVTTIFLAEAGIDAIATGLAGREDRRVAGQLRMLAKDGAFHESYCLGWLRVLTRHERGDVEHAIESRLARARRWVNGIDGGRPNVAFESACQRLADAVGHPLSADSAPATSDWNARLRRSSALPPGLWELCRFKDAEALA